MSTATDKPDSSAGMMFLRFTTLTFICAVAGYAFAAHHWNVPLEDGSFLNGLKWHYSWGWALLSQNGHNPEFMARMARSYRVFFLDHPVWLLWMATANALAVFTAFALDRWFIPDRREGNTMSQTHVGLGCLAYLAIAAAVIGLASATAGTAIGIELEVLKGWVIFGGLLLAPLAWLAARILGPARPPAETSDVRDVVKTLLGRPKFEPEQFFDAKKGLFVGVDASVQPLRFLFWKWYRKVPVYIPWSHARTSHKEILGVTGWGKGVLATNIAVQHCTLDHEAVIYFDPKFPGDEWAPRVIAEACSSAGKRAVFFNLRAKHPQFNPFLGTTEEEAYALLDSGVGMKAQGGDADVYKAKERAAARMVAKYLSSTSGATLRSAAGVFADVIDESHRDRTEASKAQRFWDWIDEMAGVESLQAQEGDAYDLRSALENGEFIYVVGDCDGGRIEQAQKLMLYRFVQLITNRDRSTARYACIVLDELKFMLSRPVLTALSTIRDKHCHLILQHQSLGDLEDCGELDPRAVRGAVVENTAIKLLYKVEDTKTAQDFAAKSGKINIRRHAVRMQAGMLENPGTSSDTQRDLIETNVLLNLPKGIGALYGVPGSETRLIQVSPLKAGSDPGIYKPAARPLTAAAVADRPTAQPADTPRTAATEGISHLADAVGQNSGATPEAAPPPQPVRPPLPGDSEI